MTDDMLTALAIRARIWPNLFAYDDFLNGLQRFASLVAASEREACAKVCESIDAEYHGEEVLATWCASAIRARGEK